ncbi:metallophosphoesterase [Paraburkholderia acidicola]|uniref:Metallophosphoesterase n=1 Tax=Paraburkholderia acidicola TaxID=1912599 RepID=A0ABV1LUH7_9BURK
MTKILILSDLHNEFEPLQADQSAVSKADIVVFAGDIHTKDRSITWVREFVNHPAKPVIVVAGNHEFYAGHFDKTLEKMRAAVDRTNIHFLENEEIVIGDIRFLGCTLWTDFRLYDGVVSPVASMRDARDAMNDFRTIRATDTWRRLSPADTVRRHEQSRAWLAERLSSRFAGKTIVVTHHAPSPRSIEEQFVGDSLTPAYASNLEHLMGPNMRLWIHGHMHTSFDYTVHSGHPASDTRVICNPRGYSPKYLNPDFDPGMLVEV